METSTIQRLIEQSRTGDRDAFGQIVRKYQGIVSGVVYGLLGDFHKAEDIAQETFLIAWSKLQDLREVEKLPGWLCGIARNQTKKYLERNSKLASLSDLDNADFSKTSDEPVGKLIREEQNRLIWNALERIPENYRIPLVLYYRNKNSRFVFRS